MFKTIFLTILSFILGISGTLYTINWQDEKVVYELSDFAKFGDITYQNLRIKNEGWNPATNVIYSGPLRQDTNASSLRG